MVKILKEEPLIMSFLRRLSLTHHHKDKDSTSSGNTTLFHLEDQSQQENNHDRIEELNRNFTHRDADIYAPQLVKDMSWEKFNERVLDCGCGCGRTGFTHFLPQVYLHDSHLYAVDSSESLVSYACMKYPHPSVTYAHGDVMSENFPFKFIKFDKIFALHMLQCVKDHRKALQHLFDLLRPSGQLGLTFATDFYCDQLEQDFSQEEEWKEYFVEEENSENDLKHHDHYEIRFKDYLQNTGFEIIQVKSEKLEYTFPNVEKAVGYYIASSPTVKSIPAELQDPFEEQCLSKMMEKFNISNPSDPVTVTYTCIYAVAKKPGFPHKDNKPKHGKLRTRFSLP